MGPVTEQLGHSDQEPFLSPERKRHGTEGEGEQSFSFFQRSSSSFVDFVVPRMAGKEKVMGTK